MDPWIDAAGEELMWVEDIASAQAALRRLAKAADVDYFAYGNARPGFDKPYWDCNYPVAWMDHYFAKQYQFIDPVVEESKRTHVPFTWRYLWPSCSLDLRRGYTAFSIKIRTKYR